MSRLWRTDERRRRRKVENRAVFCWTRNHNSISKSRGFKKDYITRLKPGSKQKLPPHWSTAVWTRKVFPCRQRSQNLVDVLWEFYIRHICMYLLVFPSTGKSDKGLQIKLSNIFNSIWLLSWWLANLCLSLLHWALATLRQLKFFFRCYHITSVDFDPRNGFSPCYTEIAEDSRCLKTFHIATGAKVVLASVTGKSGKYVNISQIF